MKFNTMTRRRTFFLARSQAYFIFVWLAALLSLPWSVFADTLGSLSPEEQAIDAFLERWSAAQENPTVESFDPLYDIYSGHLPIALSEVAKVEKNEAKWLEYLLTKEAGRNRVAIDEILRTVSAIPENSMNTDRMNVRLRADGASGMSFIRGYFKRSDHEGVDHQIEFFAQGPAVMVTVRSELEQNGHKSAHHQIRYLKLILDEGLFSISEEYLWPAQPGWNDEEELEHIFSTHPLPSSIAEARAFWWHLDPRGVDIDVKLEALKTHPDSLRLMTLALLEAGDIVCDRYADVLIEDVPSFEAFTWYDIVPTARIDDRCLRHKAALWMLQNSEIEDTDLPIIAASYEAMSEVNWKMYVDAEYVAAGALPWWGERSDTLLTLLQDRFGRSDFSNRAALFKKLTPDAQMLVVDQLKDLPAIELIDLYAQTSNPRLILLLDIEQHLPEYLAALTRPGARTRSHLKIIDKLSEYLDRASAKSLTVSANDIDDALRLCVSDNNIDIAAKAIALLASRGDTAAFPDPTTIKTFEQMIRALAILSRMTGPGGEPSPAWAPFIPAGGLPTETHYGDIDTEPYLFDATKKFHDYHGSIQWNGPWRCLYTENPGQMRCSSTEEDELNDRFIIIFLRRDKKHLKIERVILRLGPDKYTQRNFISSLASSTA